MKRLRQEKSVMGGGSSASSVLGEEGMGGGLRRRAIGGGRALSRKGKEKRLVVSKGCGNGRKIGRGEGISTQGRGFRSSVG